MTTTEPEAPVVRYGAHTPKYPGPSCDICMTTTGKLVTDHCHSHEWVRGTLCLACNTRIAFIDRRVSPGATSFNIEAAVEYANRCPDCDPLTVTMLGPTRSLRTLGDFSHGDSTRTRVERRVTVTLYHDVWKALADYCRDEHRSVSNAVNYLVAIALGCAPTPPTKEH